MRTLNRLIVIAALLGLAYQANMCFAQNELLQGDSIDDNVAPPDLRKNGVFLDLGGAGGFYSVGIERRVVRLKTDKWHLWISVDFGYQGKMFNFPVDAVGSFNLAVTYGSRHMVDVEIGSLWAMDFSVPLNSLPDNLRAKREGGNFEVTFSSYNSIGIGYRWLITPRWEIRARPLWIFKYDYDFGKLTNSFPWVKLGVSYKFHFNRL